MQGAIAEERRLSGLHGFNHAHGVARLDIIVFELTQRVFTC